jgi:hypothetical protein
MNSAVLAGSLCSPGLSLVLALAAFQAAGSAQAADVSLYMVKKGLCYTQTKSSQPTADTSNGFPFQTDVYPMVQGLVTNAFIKVAGSNSFTPLTLTSSDTHYQFKKSKNTLKTLNKCFPDGQYLLAIYGEHDGLVSASLPLQGDAYPLTPYVTNFTLLQSINANGYCVLGWQGYGAGAETDFIRLTVEDSAGNQYFQTPNLQKQGALSGLATYALIGPGTFATGQTYTATLNFQKNTVVNLTNYPSALGVAGYFTETKLSVVTSMAAAPDVKQVEVSKGSLWSQTNSGPPIPDPSGQYEFKSTAKAYLAGVLTNGTLVLPATPAGPSTQDLALQSDQVTLQFADTAASATALDSLYGPGNYTLDFNTPHNGAKSLTLALQSVTNAPPPPHVSNFDSLQAVDPSQPFTVSWDNWSAGAPSDFVRLEIDDLGGNRVFQSPNLGSQNALDGSATNCTVAAGTLFAGQSYTATLTFTHVAGLNVTTYPAVLLLGDYVSRTAFSIGTQGAVTPAVLLTISRANASHLVQVGANVTPLQAYRLDGSPVLPPVWTPLWTNIPAGNTLLFLDPNSAGQPQFFYRLVTLP